LRTGGESHEDRLRAVDSLDLRTHRLRGVHRCGNGVYTMEVYTCAWRCTPPPQRCTPPQPVSGGVYTCAWRGVHRCMEMYLHEQAAEVYTSISLPETLRDTIWHIAYGDMMYGDVIYRDVIYRVVIYGT
jgi:hypothetical protein